MIKFDDGVFNASALPCLLVQSEKKHKPALRRFFGSYRFICTSVHVLFITVGSLGAYGSSWHFFIQNLIKGTKKNSVFYQYFASPSQALGCYWLYRKIVSQ